MKKYLLIGEVANLLNISQSRLRYLEKIINLSVLKIRGRRYYKTSDIKKITERREILPGKIETTESASPFSPSAFPDLVKTLVHTEERVTRRNIDKTKHNIAKNKSIEIEPTSNSDDNTQFDISEKLAQISNEILQLDFFSHISAKPKIEYNKKWDTPFISDLGAMSIRLKECRQKLLSLVGE